jgi:hypothetical protein
MDLVLRQRGHLRVPLPYELRVLVDLFWLDLVKDNRVDVLSASQDLRKAPLDVVLELSSFGGAVYERLQSTALLLVVLLIRAGLSCADVSWFATCLPPL